MRLSDVGYSSERQPHRGWLYAPAFFSILAQESFSGSVRLKTRLPGSRVGIEAEVADALELEAVLKLGVGERRLKLCVR